LSVQTLAPGEFEVIVVDDGSTDDTVDMLKAQTPPYSLKVIAQAQNAGQPAAENRGAEVAVGDLVLFVDDDLECDVEMLAHHVSAHRTSAANVVIAGRILDADPDLGGYFSSLMQRDFEDRIARSRDLESPRDLAHACVPPNASLRREEFLRAGGFDAITFARRGSDRDLGLRLWRLGFEFHFAPAAVAYHSWMKSSEDACRECEFDGANLVKLLQAHPEARGANLAFRRFFAAPAWRRTLVLFVARRTAMVQRLLGPIILSLERRPRPLLAWRIGWRLFLLRRALLTLTGAVRQAGSPQALGAMVSAAPACEAD
jgi:glycosyltransferase involved in cell wall biosynthesis